MARILFLIILCALPALVVPIHNSSAGGCAIIRPPRDGGIRYRGLTQEQIRSVRILPVDYEIEYICRENRQIAGPKVRKCLPNGTWTDMMQLSVCLLQCPKVWTSLENGRVTARPPGPPAEGTVLHYSCNSGFTLEGRNISHCTKLGKWDAPKPTCLYDRNYTETLDRIAFMTPTSLNQILLRSLFDLEPALPSSTCCPLSASAEMSSTEPTT